MYSIYICGKDLFGQKHGRKRIIDYCCLGSNLKCREVRRKDFVLLVLLIIFFFNKKKQFLLILIISTFKDAAQTYSNCQPASDSLSLSVN